MNHGLLNRRHIDRILLGLSFLVLLLFAYRPQVDYDLGTHLKGGEWILENGRVQDKDPYTWTVNDRDYVNLSWAYQVVLTLVHRTCGDASLTWFNLLLTAVLGFLLLGRMTARGTPPAVAAGLLFWGSLTIEPRIASRPETVSWILLAMTLGLLERRWSETDGSSGEAPGHGNRTRLWLLPALQVVWVNVHGLFILGWYVMGAFLLGGRVHRGKWDTGLARWSLLAVAASFLNPYGWKGVAFPAVLFTRMQESNLFKQYVSELFPPFSARAQAMYFSVPSYMTAFVFLGAAWLVLNVLSFRRTRVQEWLTGAAFLGLGLTAVRNIPFLAVAVIPFLPSLVPERLRTMPRSWAGLSRATLAAVLVVTGARVVTNDWYLDNGSTCEFGAGVSGRCQPAAAADFLRMSEYPGPMINHLNLGGYLNWKSDRPAFIDGRLEVMGEAHFAEYLASFGGKGLSERVDRRGANLIVHHHAASTDWTLQVMRMADWELVHLDPVAAVYARRAVRSGSSGVDAARVVRERGVPAALSGDAVRGLLARSKPSLTKALDGWFRVRRHPGEWFALGNFAFLQGDMGTAEKCYLEGLRLARGDHYPSLRNIAVLYQRTGRWDLAEIALRNCVAHGPRDRAELERQRLVARERSLSGGASP